jgi:hypothetical protein
MHAISFFMIFLGYLSDISQQVGDKMLPKSANTSQGGDQKRQDEPA